MKKILLLFTHFDTYIMKTKFLRSFTMDFKHKIKKYYKIISSFISVLVSASGLVLSLLAFFSDDYSNQIIYLVMVLSEIFLIVSTIYSVILVIKNQADSASIDDKNYEIAVIKNSEKTIFENNKAIITTYKDFYDKLNQILKNYEEREKSNINLLSNHEEQDEILNFINNSRNIDHNELKETLISIYNRFLSSTTNLLKMNIEEYLKSKGCNESVSIAVKQLSKPTDITKLSDNIDVYTAFRDSRTYNSKKRNETWKKKFKISKNSDFVMSNEKDFYIFNFMDKHYLDDGLYQNENTAFYENYNSGVTCTIYSCINGKRILYGYLACDSFFTNKTKKRVGKNIYDSNIANMMMYTAHIIAIFMEKFQNVWNSHYVAFQPDIRSWLNKDVSTLNDNEKSDVFGFCSTMVNSVKSTRYNR